MPAQVWKDRRRAVVPGFHQAWLNSMCNMFGTCTERLVTKLDALADTGTVINMEENWNSCSLDIIGKAIFNYDFGSVDNCLLYTSPSPRDGLLSRMPSSA